MFGAEISPAAVTFPSPYTSNKGVRFLRSSTTWTTGTEVARLEEPVGVRAATILQPTVLRWAGAALYSPYSLHQVACSPSYSTRIRSGQLLADDESSTTLTVDT